MFIFVLWQVQDGASATLDPRHPEDMTRAELAQLSREYERLGHEKINSSTHKLPWNALYRMTQNTPRGPKVDKEIYDKWHAGDSTALGGLPGEDIALTESANTTRAEVGSRRRTSCETSLRSAIARMIPTATRQRVFRSEGL